MIECLIQNCLIRLIMILAQTFRSVSIRVRGRMSLMVMFSRTLGRGLSSRHFQVGREARERRDDHRELVGEEWEEMLSFGVYA